MWALYDRAALRALGYYRRCWEFYGWDAPQTRRARARLCWAEGRVS